MKILSIIHELGILVAIILKIMGIVDISWMTIILFSLFAIVRTDDLKAAAKEFFKVGDIVAEIRKDIRDLKKETKELRLQLEEMYE